MFGIGRLMGIRLRPFPFILTLHLRFDSDRVILRHIDGQGIKAVVAVAERLFRRRAPGIAVRALYGRKHYI